MKIYLIRHGETSWNTLGRLQGRTDIELNENGIRLAKITGEKLKDVHFDLAIASPLKRAYETAGLVLGDRNIPILTDERIEEISFGEWEGLCCRRENYQTLQQVRISRIIILQFRQKILNSSSRIPSVTSHRKTANLFSR